MKKVLILEGSPRFKGNSCILSDEFARSAEEAGYTVEKIPVARKKVAGRLGCNACYAASVFSTAQVSCRQLQRSLQSWARGFWPCPPAASSPTGTMKNWNGA